MESGIWSQKDGRDCADAQAGNRIVKPANAQTTLTLQPMNPHCRSGGRSAHAGRAGGPRLGDAPAARANLSRSERRLTRGPRRLHLAHKATLRTRQVTIESGRAAKAARRLRLSAAVRAIVSFRVLSRDHQEQWFSRLTT